MQVTRDQVPVWLSVQMDAELNIDDSVWQLVDGADPQAARLRVVDPVRSQDPRGWEAVNWAWGSCPPVA
jgi:hypothetical protein